MREEELMDKIRKSSKDVKIPEELQPKEIEKKLKSMKKYSGRWIGVLGTAAAAMLLVCILGAVFRIGYIGNQDKAEASELKKNLSPKKDAGDLYQVAEDYSQVYQALEPVTVYDDMDKGESSGTGFLQELIGDVKGLRNSDDMDMAEGIAEESAAAGVEDAASVENASSKQSGSYSKTNVQTEGVDESDIIKTDGKYVYVVSGKEVAIIDITGRDMKIAGNIAILDTSASVSVEEMYVDGDRLNLILQKEDTSLMPGDMEFYSDPKYGSAEKESAVTEETDSKQPEDSYQMVSKTVTELLTYDISDRKNPKQLGVVTQDGSYLNSRKIGDVIYLFTEEYMQQTGVENEQMVTKEEAGGFIPLVNGKMIEADCVYLPQQGANGFVISSVNQKKPDEVIDNVLIINDYAQIYVSKDAIYLYNNDYSGSGAQTRIAKFSLKNGEINAVNAAAVPGEVYDTFAVAEEKGNLRILTTDWSGSEDSNNLYLFDEKLNIIGKLEGMAEGEQIYAARFLGDMAYFVTYRNTDPLFAVDISDPKNPQILSEVKLSGFSEYLHFWGKDKLVGIGYETDEESGAQQGLKLVIFDIKNPKKVTVEKEFVIENADYSPALNFYKTVLADPEENLLGFAMTSYDNNGESDSYLLFSIEDGTFHNLFSAALNQNAGLEEYRGVYAGDVFYVVSPRSITSYDRKDNYKKIGDLEL